MAALGPNAVAVRRLDLGTGKRAHVAKTLAHLLDQRPGGDPSIREIAALCRRHRYEVSLTIDKLVAEGHVRLVHRGDHTARQRTVYAPIVAHELPPPNTKPKEKNHL